MTRFLTVLALAGSLLLPARGQAAERLTLRPDQFFDGNLQSWGYFKMTGAKIGPRFTMHAHAAWYNDKGNMRESFAFSDGTKKDRQWTFTMIDDSHFVGTAPDVIGQAYGETSGSSMHWVYTIMLPVKGHDVAVKFDDTLTLVDENHMFSEVSISKLGLPIGEMLMFFEKPAAAAR